MLSVITELLLIGLMADAMSSARRSFELQRAGDLSGAEQQIREAVQLDPGNPLFHSALSGILVQTHRPFDAITELQTALDCHPNDSARVQLESRLEQMSLSAAAELAKASKFDEGLTLATGVANRLPRSAAIFQMLGYFQAKLRLHPEAVDSYRRSVAIDAHSADAAIGLAIAQADAGMAAAAVRTFEAGINNFPQDARFPQALGNALLADGDPHQTARAAALFRKALSLDPALAESHYQLGNLALRTADYAAAAEHLEAAAQLSRSDNRIHFALARLYRVQHKDAEAEREMGLFLRNAP